MSMREKMKNQAKESKEREKSRIEEHFHKSDTRQRNVFFTSCIFFPPLSLLFDFYRCAARKKEKETSGFSRDASSRETCRRRPRFHFFFFCPSASSCSSLVLLALGALRFLENER